MRKPSLPWLALFACTSLAAACGDDDSGGDVDAAAPDATVPDAALPDAALPDAARPDAAAAAVDLTCAGFTPPTTAPDPLTFSGNVQQGLLSATASANARVSAHLRSDDSELGFVVTDAAGDFSFTAATGGAAQDAYAKASKATFLDLYVYPPDPVYDNLSGLALVLGTGGELDLLHSFSGGPGRDIADGDVIAVVIDCNGDEVPGAVVTITGAEAIAYMSGGLPSVTATGTAADGVGIGLNVTADTAVTVQATYMGTPFKANTITVRANAITATILHP
jgi:hypothetical protein